MDEHWLDTLQRENGVWVERNFSPRPWHHPLLGLIEELGELEEAEGPPADVALVADAIADVYIFAADFCNAANAANEHGRNNGEPWSLGQMHMIATAKYRAFGEVQCLINIGRLCHAMLKREQGIRGDAAKHDAKMRDALVGVLMHVQSMATVWDINLQMAVQETWAQVKLRNWKCGTCRHPLPHPSLQFCDGDACLRPVALPF